ncbi:MAG: 30S ribosomal protein S9 [Opitutales bacterium]|jgi:small subunit ribosomal protein S9|nr:30S ribosomal protein S9 [Opitutales bacterium]
MTTETTNLFLGTGRRKRASARVRLFANGSGKITINGKTIEDYLPGENIVRAAEAPLHTVNKKSEFDAIVSVQGGGPHGQATAIALGIARALEKFDGELRGDLKRAGHLMRDPRRRERKKAGQPGARKRFQFSKR